MAWGNQGRNHYVYGAGTWSKYYWNKSYNPNADFENCMANCTTYAYGRVRENGLPAPVTRIINANNWHTVVNTSAGWSLIRYIQGMSLQAGDILEWEAIHVAVVETNGTNPGVSASWYTGDDGTADSDRSTAVMGNSLASVSNWMVSHRPNRFYHYVDMRSENDDAGGGAYPKYVLRYSGSGPTPPEPPEPGGDTPTVSVAPSSASGTISANASYVDFSFTITVSGIPVNEDASDAISFSNNCYRQSYTSGWEYTDYTVGGVTYRTGTRSLIVRYDRLHSYAYTDTAYMYYRKTFSNGSVNSTTRMNITVQDSGVDDELIIEISAYLNKKKKKNFTVKIL